MNANSKCFFLIIFMLFLYNFLTFSALYFYEPEGVYVDGVSCLFTSPRLGSMLEVREGATGHFWFVREYSVEKVPL